ncbi:hypothetical protein ACHWQZ_G016982 [Mnemiopsis leidyi]
MTTIIKTFLLLGTLFCVAESACKEGKLTEFEQAVLDAHNQLRANHEGTKDLCYAVSGDDVTFISQQWANSMAQEKKMHHSSGDYGENLAYAASSGERPGQKESYIRASKSWYGEIKDWNFKESKKRGTGVTGHFTQLVWKETQQVNCAYSEYMKGELNAYYVVCQYFPRGNFGGEADFAENVGQIAAGADLSEYEIGGGSAIFGKMIIVLVTVSALFFTF